MKRSFFHAVVVWILLFGCSTWTLTKRMEKNLDGNDTRMLRAILNNSGRHHPSKQLLYGHLPLITKTIKVRRTRHAEHYWMDFLQRNPSQRRAKVERTTKTYIQPLYADTGCNPEYQPEAMNDSNREWWREI